MPKVVSSSVPTASSSGFQKLGQPVPLSNCVGRIEVEIAASTRRKAFAVFLKQRAGARPLGIGAQGRQTAQASSLRHSLPVQCG